MTYTTAQLREAIEGVLRDTPFTGLSIPYTEAVITELRKRAPGASHDVYHRYKDLVVESRSGNSVHKLVLTIGT